MRMRHLFIMAFMGFGQCAHANRIKLDSFIIETAAFQCPSECVECCDSSGLFKKGFKCILRDPLSVPADRNCGTPEWRVSNSQHKTHCKYIGNETKAAEKCSSVIKCCCAVNENWTEERCFPSASSGIIQAISNRNGKAEDFQMRFTNLSAYHQIYTNKGPCKRSVDGRLNEHHPFDVLTFPSEHGKPASKYNRPHTPCCLETETKTILHRWRGTKKTDYYKKQKTYTKCVLRETLHYCSDDGGLTANGHFLYDRVSRTQKGFCVGDAQTESGKGELLLPITQGCPGSTVEGKWCNCDGHCGDIWKS